jgi:predicted RNase H-like HicB family nuclease
MTYETEIATPLGAYTAVITPAKAGRFVAVFPAFPCLVVAGETVEQASRRAHECLLRHLMAPRPLGHDLTVIR